MTLIAREFKPELEFQAGTSSLHALYTFENIGYIDVSEDVGGVVGRIHEYVPIVTYVCFAYVRCLAYLGAVVPGSCRTWELLMMMK